MRKRSLISLLIILVLLLTACSINPSSETPDGNSQQGSSLDSPGDGDSKEDPADNTGNKNDGNGTGEEPTDRFEPIPLTADEIAELQNIYQLRKTETGHLATNFYNFALGMVYSDPRDISLIWFFREGDHEEFERTRMTDEEYAFIKSVDSNAENVDWYRISAQDVENILQMCFGLSLSDMNNIDDLQFLHYWEETDCYYSGTTSPAPFADNFIITGGTHLEDGTLKVFYTSQEGNVGELMQFVMILKPVNSGYHILSNQLAAVPE